MTTGAVEKQSITYSECMCVALGFQPAMRLHHKCHLLCAWFCNIFPSYPINGMIWGVGGVLWGGKEREKQKKGYRT